MSRPKITDENGDGHFGFGELLKPATVDALISQHNEHADALDTMAASAVTLPIAESDVTGLVADLAGKAAASHTHAESDITNLTTDLAAKVPTTRTISTTAPLTGGGDLSANRTLAVSTFGSANSGVVPASGGGTTNFLRADGSWVSAGGTFYPNTFWIGAGSKGALVFDGTSTVAGLVPGTNNQYPQNGTATYLMTQDLDCTNITVNANVSLITQGWRIFWTGTFTNNGFVGSPGEKPNGSGAGTSISAGFYGGGVAGGAAAVNTSANGSNGGASSNAARIWATVAAGNATGSGQGGSGGSAGAQTGGLGGSVTIGVTTDGTLTLMNMMLGRVGSNFSTQLSYGSGGGGGAVGSYTSGTSGGGGGGSGGGITFMAGNILAGSGTFSVAGGAGGPSTDSGGATNPAGGGGGGGGGLGGMVYNHNTGTCTFTAAGGAGSAGVGGGNSGNNGAAGTWIVASGDGT